MISKVFNKLQLKQFNNSWGTRLAKPGKVAYPNMDENSHIAKFLKEMNQIENAVDDAVSIGSVTIYLKDGEPAEIEILNASKYLREVLQKKKQS